jgi:hypothetical protein
MILFIEIVLFNVQRKVCGPQKEEVIRGWRKSRNEELRNLCSTYVFRVVILRRMRWAGHVARIRRDQK